MRPIDLSEPRLVNTLPVWHGIYFLCSGEGISYIGQSQKRDEGIKGRLWEHWQRPRIPFGYVVIISLARTQELIDQWEKAGITTFWPEWNRSGRSPTKPIKNDVMNVPEFLLKMGKQHIREIFRVTLQAPLYSPERAWLEEPYRAIRR